MEGGRKRGRDEKGVRGGISYGSEFPFTWNVWTRVSIWFVFLAYFNAQSINF